MPYVESARPDLRGVTAAALRIADQLRKAGWSWGCVAAIDREGRTIKTGEN
jgi:hypothetical protein